MLVERLLFTCFGKVQCSSAAFSRRFLVGRGWLSKKLIISEVKMSQFSCAVFGGNVNELFRFWNGEMYRFSVTPFLATIHFKLEMKILFLPVLTFIDGSWDVDLGWAHWHGCCPFDLGLLVLVDWWWFLTNSGRHKLNLDRVFKLCS